MKTVRYGVFETNSSSTHVLTYTPKEKWEKFVAGDPNLIWLRFNPMTEDTPCDKSDNIVEVKDYAKYLCEHHPDDIGTLPLEFVETFIRIIIQHKDSSEDPIGELLYKLDSAHTYQEMKELSGDFEQVGDYDWDRSEVKEVVEGDNTFVRARAVWFDG